MTTRQLWCRVTRRRTSVRRLALLFSVVCSARTSVGAQAAEQGLIDSLVVGLEHPLPLGSVPDLTLCRGRRGDLGTLCEGMVLLRHAVPAPDSVASTSPNGVLSLSGVDRHLFQPAFIEGYRHALTAQRRLQGVSRTYPGVVWYALARLKLAKGTPVDSVDGLLAQARTAGGLAPGVLDLLEARLRFREGDSAGAWRAWERMLADSTALTGAVAWALLRRAFPPELIRRWDGTASVAAVSELSASPLHRSLVPVYLGQPPAWIPLEATGRGYLLFRRGAPLLVGVFALPRQQLVWENPGVVDDETVRVFYPIDIEITAAQGAAGKTARHETSYRIPSRLPPSDWEFIGSPSDSMTRRSPLGARGGARDCGQLVRYRQFLVPCGPTPLLPDSQAAGLVIEQGVGPGQTAVTVALRQVGGRGTIQTFVVRPVPDADTLFASDLVLGMPGRGYAWRSFEHLVPMHPTGIYPSGATLSLFTQLRGLTPDTTYQVTLELLEDTDAANARVLLTVRSTEEARAAEAEWYKQVQLVDMKPGRYRVRVTFRQGGAEVVREDRMTIVR